MRWTRPLALGAVVVLWLAGTVVLADHHEGSEVKLQGSYVWERSDKNIPGDIEAVFTPTGDQAWDVVFQFEWEGEMRAWKGTARGNLTKGKLEGEATEDRDRERTFVFEGKVEDGVFNGKHGAVRDGEMNHLGTITFEPFAGP